MEEKKIRIVVGITAASGAIYAKLLLERLAGLTSQILDAAIIFSPDAIAVWEYELGRFDAEKIPFLRYDPGDLFAPMASGSAGYDSMIIIPCTMGTLGRIASGYAGDLMTRAADVMLKERKKLILVPRETPLNLIHLRNMKLLAEAGTVICPASPSFYAHPATLEELAMTVVDRVLLQAGFEIPVYRWGESD